MRTAVGSHYNLPKREHVLGRCNLTPHPIDNQFLNPKEVAYLLNVSVRTVTHWAGKWKATRGQDGIPSIKVGKLWRFEKEEMLRWLARRRDAARQPGSVRHASIPQQTRDDM